MKIASHAEEVLHALWDQTLNTANSKTTNLWQAQQIYVASMGVGMEEVLDYLFVNRPVFEDFKHWITSAGILPSEMQEYPHKVLSSADHDHFRDSGYVVVREAVTQKDCEAAREAIWHYLGANLAQPDSWYNPDSGKRGMMLRLFQHEALTQTRYAPKIRKAYEEIYGTGDIFLPVDKVSFNPPETEKFRFAGSPLHWDVSLKIPIPFELQGFLYLTDTRHNEGAFHCVPGFHNTAESWLSGLPAGSNPRDLAPDMLSPIAVPGNAGDLVIWHQALPHCATPNKGSKPRMVQYIAYKPIVAAEAAEWI